MPIEYEAKVIEINPQEMEKKILACGGEKLKAAKMRRYVYDLESNNQTRKWLRLRDTGTEVTLTVKEIRHDGIDGTEENEIMVPSFEDTHQILLKMNHTPKGYQENYRTSFVLENARLEIDHWPQIPPYLEIEADSRELVIKTASKLGFTEENLTGENTTKIYAHYGIDIHSITNLKFEE
ncbi:CYTH domain-containing protein [Hazenella sp. IB182353]|uniref:class IV adenylate cyclase n=1 Tax=Polycladospora coralii TaxID=2771432 RepID=UPI0017463FFB|nr:CYTH domain-containing protein [Polycladospora coralii]MBS7530795.1 CYTH domain-containing protein [Polycladospora coralii]